MSRSQSAETAPPLEQLRKGSYEPPAKNLDVDRPFYRKLDPFQALFQRGYLEQAPFAASRKLLYHYEGSMGRDVRLDEGGGRGAGVEFARTYHSQMIADAEQQVTPRQWKGLKIMLEETGDLQAIGGAICRVKNPPQARAAALELIKGGLDLLALHWGHASR